MQTIQKTGRILLIDDDPLFANILRRRGEAKGFKIDCYTTIVEALYDNYLDVYDAAIVDCCMPQLSGFETSKYLAKFFDQTAVVLVSQGEDSFDRYLDDQAGAAAFVSKSQGAEVILAAAQRLIRNVEAS